MGGGFTTFDFWDERKGKAELPAMWTFLEYVVMVVTLTEIGDIRRDAVLLEKMMGV